MSEFLTEKKLFQETFGGTTFKHLIEWCKEKRNNKEKHNNLEHTIKHLIEWSKKSIILMNGIMLMNIPKIQYGRLVCLQVMFTTYRKK